MDLKAELERVRHIVEAAPTEFGDTDILAVGLGSLARVVAALAERVNRLETVAVLARMGARYSTPESSSLRDRVHDAMHPEPGSGQPPISVAEHNRLADEVRAEMLKAMPETPVQHNHGAGSYSCPVCGE